MKRFFIFLLVLAMTFSLAACNGAEDGKTQSGNNGAEGGLQQEPQPGGVPDEGADKDLPDGEAYMARLAEQGWESSDFSGHSDYSYIVPGLTGGKFEARSADLSEWELVLDHCLRMDYNSRTVFPDTMPEGFDPEAELELGMDPGLNVRKLHARGVTGAGVSIGIVDQELSPHIEYNGKIRYYNNPNPEIYRGSMHGPAVTSIAVGERVGVAPGAAVYYACTKWTDENGAFLEDDGTEEFYKTMFLDPIHHLLDLNETLPPEDKMSVISVSRGFDASMDIYKEAVSRAEEQGVWLLTVTELFDRGFGGLYRKPLADPNDPGVFSWSGSGASSEGVGIPMDRRAYASPTGEDEYEYGSIGGISWCEPYLAGVYALARQVDPELTVDDFVALSRETAYAASPGARIGMILDPTALIEALEAR